MFRISKQALARITLHAKENADLEVVGLVTEHANGRQSVFPLRNAHKDPVNYYEVDPAELMTTYRRMEDLEHLPVAFYHSHPKGSPSPSETDMQGALNGGMHYLIAYPAESAWMVSAWECIETQILVSAEMQVVG